MSTLRTAIYARKSTEQNGLAEESKSVARQVEHATVFAARKGWTVDSAAIFIDDGVSGALFGDKRPGLARLLNVLSPRPPFQVLVMSEESRLGREAIETGWTLKRGSPTPACGYSSTSRIGNARSTPRRTRL
jgi:DNA invertase Pin-like site-specific DNA recombinase